MVDQSVKGAGGSNRVQGRVRVGRDVGVQGPVHVAALDPLELLGPEAHRPKECTAPIISQAAGQLMATRFVLLMPAG